MRTLLLLALAGAGAFLLLRGRRNAEVSAAGDMSFQSRLQDRLAALGAMSGGEAERDAGLAVTPSMLPDSSGVGLVDRQIVVSQLPDGTIAL